MPATNSARCLPCNYPKASMNPGNNDMHPLPKGYLHIGIMMLMHHLLLWATECSSKLLLLGGSPKTPISSRLPYALIRRWPPKASTATRSSRKKS